MEMNLLLGPLSLALGCALTTGIALGFPYVFRVVAGPTGHHDPATLAFLFAVLSAWFTAWMAWTLGILTIRREIYRFGADFWVALAFSTLGTALTMRFISPLALYGMLPVWLFAAHMAVLQWRLRSMSALAVRANTRCAS